jgi:hypothetical protein
MTPKKRPDAWSRGAHIILFESRRTTSGQDELLMKKPRSMLEIKSSLCARITGGARTPTIGASGNGRVHPERISDSRGTWQIQWGLNASHKDAFSGPPERRGGDVRRDSYPSSLLNAVSRSIRRSEVIIAIPDRACCTVDPLRKHQGSLVFVTSFLA